MSIIIKVEEINLLIYKYLLESGLIHTAFSLFHETNLEKIIKNYEEEIKELKSGLLIHYLERGLMLNQIESHIEMNEYCECNEAFQLIKQHTCTIVEKKRENKTKEKNENKTTFIETLKKTTDYQVNNNNSVNNLIIDEKYLYQISKNMVLNPENISLVRWNSDKNILTLYEHSNNVLYFWSSSFEDQTKLFNISAIVPISQGDYNAKIIFLEWDSACRFLLCILENNNLMIFDIQGNLQRMFVLSSKLKPQKIKWSKHLQNLVAILYADEYEIIDPFEGIVYVQSKDALYDFDWRVYEEYSISSSLNGLSNHKIGIDNAITKYNCEIPPISLKWNINSTLMASYSDKMNCLQIWTTRSENHFMSLSDEDKIIDYLWGGSIDDTISTNFIVAATDKFIKVWDIEFGSRKYKHECKYKINSILLLGNTLSNSFVVTNNYEGKINIYSLKEDKDVSYSWEDAITNIYFAKDYQIGFFYKKSAFLLDVKKLVL